MPADGCGYHRQAVVAPVAVAVAVPVAVSVAVVVVVVVVVVDFTFDHALAVGDPVAVAHFVMYC